MTSDKFTVDNVIVRSTCNFCKIFVKFSELLSFLLLTILKILSMLRKIFILQVNDVIIFTSSNLLACHNCIKNTTPVGYRVNLLSYVQINRILKKQNAVEFTLKYKGTIRISVFKIFPVFNPSKYLLD